MSYKIGQKVRMTDEALDNYGEEYRDKVFVVTHVSTKYMPASQFYAGGRPPGYHPGYDEAAAGKPLYDLELDGEPFGSSLYWWELTD